MIISPKISIPTFFSLLAAIAVSVILLGCNGERDGDAKKIDNIMQMNSPKFTVGCMTGFVATDEAKKILPAAQYREYAMPIDAFTAICAKKIDAVVLDRPTLEYMALAHSDLFVMKDDIAVGHISVASAKNNQKLMTSVNDFIRKYREDGTYQDMFSRWFHKKDSKMPAIPSGKKTGGILKIGVTGNNEPLCFIQNGEYAGFDAEFALRLGAHLNKKVEFTNLPYDAMVLALQSGKIDLAIAFMDAIPERRESVLFSDNYIDAPITAIVRKDICTEQLLKGISRYEDLNSPSRKIACMSEVLATWKAKEKLPEAKYLEFSSPMPCIDALTAKKVDAVIYDRPPLEYAILERHDLHILSDDIAQGHISIAASKSKKDLIEKVNVFIQKYREDGTYDQMYDRWIHSKELKMPEIERPKNPDGKLFIGVTSDNPPMCTVVQGNYIGFDIEFAYRLGLYLNKEIVFRDMLYDALITAMQSGKIDIAIAQMDATPERCETVAFSKEYIDSPISVMIRKEDFSGNDIASINDLKGKKIGTLTGSCYDLVAKPYLPSNVKILNFSQINQQVAALESKKIDAFLTDDPIARFILLQRPNLTKIDKKIPCGDYAFVFSKQNRKLCAQFSAEIKKMKAEGLLDKLQDKWFSLDQTKQTLPTIPKTSKEITIAALAETQPFAYVQGDKIVGYDVETAMLAAQRLGYSPNIVTADTASIIENVNSGKADLALGCIIITKERQETMLFSEPTYQGGISLVVRKAAANQTSAGGMQWFIDTWNSLASSFEKTFIRESRWKLILQGLGTTIVITVFAVLFGSLFAFPVCMMCRSKRKILAWLGDKYVSLIMGTPILVILMILYYVIFAKVDISGVIVAIIAFSMDFAAYTSLTLRAGIDGIPRGQMEAALALGHTPSAAFMRFILPQAIRTVLPVYRGEIISTLKATSIVGYIAIMDLTKMGDIIRSRTYEAFFPLIAIAVIYFFTAKCLTYVLTVLEKRMNPEYHRDQLKERGAK